MIQTLSKEERQSYHNLYRKDDLFKHWFSILSINREHFSIDPVTIWHASQNVIDQLRKDQLDRAEMVEYIIDGMHESFESNSVVVTMCVVFTRLANATEMGKEDEKHPNDPICVAIYRYYINDALFQGLLQKLRSKKIDNYGRKVELTPHDPLTHQSTLEDVSSIVRSEMDNMFERVISNTQKLEVLLSGDNWDRWIAIWDIICHDTEFLELLKKVTPRNNEWELNQKFVCNVLGVFNKELKLHVATLKLNNTLFNNNKSSYINNYLPHNNSDSVLTNELLTKIKNIIAQS